MVTTETMPLVAARALRGYEHGRLNWAARRGALAAAIAMVALVGCRQLAVPALCALATGALLAGCLHRGGAAAAGARAGFAAGLLPCLLPAAARTSGLCQWAGADTLTVLCAGGGLIAGGLLGWSGIASARPRPYWLAAAGVAFLAGGTGCVTVGIGGVAGLVLGMTAGAAPVLARRAA